MFLLGAAVGFWAGVLWANYLAALYEPRPSRREPTDETDNDLVHANGSHAN